MTNIAPALSNSELNIRLRQQEIVADFGRMALKTDSIQEILDNASLAAAEGLESSFAKVLEYLPGDMAFLVRSGVGWREGVVGEAKVGGDLLSPAGYAFRTGKPVVSNHLEGEQRFRTPTLLVEHGIRSAINVLIQDSDGDPYGVLEGDNTYRSDFNEHDIAFLQTLANTLAVAIRAQRRQDARQVLLVEKESLLEANQVLLAEKDLLMREVHHRVMNSLQMVRTVLSMQARRMPSAQDRLPLDEAATRVMAIAAVHHRLYDGRSVTTGDAGQYLVGLLADMKHLVPDLAANRLLGFDIKPFFLAADDIAPLGLITIELVTNALKYGRGNVQVSVLRGATGLEISVSDQGDGFPAGFDPMASQGLGMKLVTALARTTDGSAVQVDRSVPFGRIKVKTAFGGSG